MNARDRERLSAAFTEAERSLPPLSPDPTATLEHGRRLLRRRRLTTMAVAATLFAVLAGGGIAARAALHGDGSATPTKKKKTRNGEKTTPGGTTTGKVSVLPDLVPTLTQTDEGATLTVANLGGADAGAFVVALGAGDYVEPFDGLGAGAQESRSYSCEGTFTATVDAEQQVEESNEDNNTAKSDCGSRPTTDTTGTTDTSTTETAPDGVD
jgi:CARDB